MSRFLTIDPNKVPVPVLLWEETDGGAPKVVGRFASLEEAPEAEALEIWRFEGPLSTGRGPANEGNYPVVDPDGAPLWPGARISFRVQTHYVNWTDGEGTFLKTDLYGGTSYVSDVPMNVYGRGGFVVDRRREMYAHVDDFRHDGEFKGCRVLAKMLGDPYEHGQTQMFVRLADDPRKVCKLEREPAAARGPR
jgi:hypothetical protein